MQKALQNSTFVKLTLANYKGTEEHLQRISIRRVETKKGARLAFQFRHSTQDVVKNFEFGESVDHVAKHLEYGFRSAHLFTTESDFQLTIGKKNARLVKSRPSFVSKPSTSHDREKRHLIDSSAYYLKELGITTDSGAIRTDQRDKWRQINKFVEIVDGLIRNSAMNDKTELRIVDMGSGKGYLTFALYDHLVRTRNNTDRIPPTQGETTTVMERTTSFLSVTGVELRPELVALCNEIAQASGFDDLTFILGTIADFDPGNVDILVALHACDTATDDALYKAISANATIIVAAPCCHHELKAQMKPPELLAGIMKHPIMMERTAETITDGIRSLLLESQGYKTKMFEFVATEHTPKNNMLVATRISSPHVSKGSPNKKAAEVNAIMSEFGIEHQRLADHIQRGEQTDAI